LNFVFFLEPGGQRGERMRDATETKVFDPANAFSPITDLLEVTDPALAKRGEQWWLYGAGQVAGKPGIQLVSASLPAGAPLSAAGWVLTPDAHDRQQVAVLAGQERSQAWDLAGGRHCPCYVKGWDPDRSEWVERIYYAGGAEHVWGPYTIGYLEWNGTQWLDQAAPVFTAAEEWEHGSVYEPNVLYADGMWKMWYVAGSNHDDYLVHGFAESRGGRTGWSPHSIFMPAHDRVFDFCVFHGRSDYEAVFSRVWVRDTPPPAETGLWWCHARTPSHDIRDWSQPVQIMSAADRGWHAGPWKPSAGYSETAVDRLLVFFSGSYSKRDGSPFPFVFTLGCLELDRPHA
jgi:hypothetical protein